LQKIFIVLISISLCITKKSIYFLSHFTQQKQHFFDVFFGYNVIMFTIIFSFVNDLLILLQAFVRNGFLNPDSNYRKVRWGGVKKVQKSEVYVLKKVRYIQNIFIIHFKQPTT